MNLKSGAWRLFAGTLVLPTKLFGLLYPPGRESKQPPVGNTDQVFEMPNETSTVTISTTTTTPDPSGREIDPIEALIYDGRFVGGCDDPQTTTPDPNLPE